MSVRRARVQGGTHEHEWSESGAEEARARGTVTAAGAAAERVQAPEADSTIDHFGIAMVARQDTEQGTLQVDSIIAFSG